MKEDITSAVCLGLKIKCRFGTSIVTTSRLPDGTFTTIFTSPSGNLGEVLGGTVDDSSAAEAAGTFERACIRAWCRTINSFLST